MRKCCGKPKATFKATFKADLKALLRALLRRVGDSLMF